LCGEDAAFNRPGRVAPFISGSKLDRPMHDPCRYAARPFAFFFHYVGQRPWSHAAMIVAVLAAVGCSIGAQYGIKFLVDTLGGGAAAAEHLWRAFALLAVLICADNLLWRLAGWVAAHTFAAVTGDVRRDLFRHLTGHAPSYFIDRFPATLTSRVTATSNAVYTVETMFVWNVLPPCAATIGAVATVFAVNGPIALALVIVAGIMVPMMFRMALAGGPLHHAFADRAAAVDGEMMDVIGNMPLVYSFGGVAREQARFDATVDSEIGARRTSLVYLEKIRIFHAVVTVVLTVAVLAWAIALWQDNAATTGEVVLVCTLGLSILHATRDLAVALVDTTQHMARLSEAVSVLLVPHMLRDGPRTHALEDRRTDIAFEDVSFSYPDGRRVLTNFDLHIEPGQRVGLVGPSGGGKSTLFALLQRFYDIQDGRILVDGQCIADLKQENLRAAIGLVPQDITLFHRSVVENIRYGRPDADDRAVEEAMMAARCDGFIAELPEGSATIVGDRGVKLSPGQRQRIAIARAFLKDAPILLLDEATSALDGESEESVREALDRLMTGRTVLAIAHRLSTLRSFDRIVVLTGGRIIEDGAPQDLMRREGAYRDLVRREMARLSRQAA
jgi:ATP-binding cassette, subfamily B, bacterial